MKKTRLLLGGVGIIFTCFCGFAAPLDNWHWRNPLPNGNPPTGPHKLNGIVFAAGKFVAVGASGTVSISLDTTNWVEGATATTNDLNGIVYAAGQFVAVGNGGVVETSADGTNWVLQTSGTTNSLNAIAYGSGKLVAVGLNAVIVSSNAVDWIPAVSGLQGAAVIAGGNNGFVSLYGGNQVLFSADGLNWTTETFNAPVPSSYGLLNEIVTYWNNMFIIGGFEYVGSESADAFMFTSADGSHWSTNMIGNDFTGSGGFNYDFFMAGSNSVIAAGAAGDVPFLQFSTNGVNWTETYDVPYANLQNNIGGTAGAYGNGNYVIIFPANLYYSLPPIFASTDGLNWTNRQHAPAPPNGPTYTLTGIASNNSVDVVVSGNLVAISSNGLSYAAVSNTPALSSIMTLSNEFIGVGPGGAVYVSTNGAAWTLRNSGTANNLHGLTAGNGLLVAVGDGGAIQTSPSGLIWTSRSSGTSLPLYSVAWSNGVFVAVGQEGTVLTSPDGINWTGQYSGVLSNLLSVVYGSAGFLAVGTGGTVVSSPDGINWSTQNPGTTGSFESVCFGNGYYLAVGDNSVAMTSPDGVSWTPRNLGATGGQNFYGSSFFGSRFEVVGSNGTILESDVIAPLFDIQIASGTAQTGFTMFATPGSSFRLQGSTNLSMSGWTDVATFNDVAAITRWTNSTSGYKQRFYRLVSP